jgi:hypothetical protein
MENFGSLSGGIRGASHVQIMTLSMIREDVKIFKSGSSSNATLKTQGGLCLNVLSNY